MSQKRILLIRPDRVGDVVLTTPLIKAIKKTFPDSYLVLMINPKTEPLLKNNPNIDKIIFDDLHIKNRTQKEFWEKVKLLKSENFNIGLMPLPTERHAWMMFFAGIKTRVGVGRILYEVLTGMKSVQKNFNPIKHEADYIFDLGRKIGLQDIELVPEIFIPNSEKENAIRLLTNLGIDLQKPIIGINPISGGSVPNWPIDKYIELSKLLSSKYQILYLLPERNLEIENKLLGFKNIFFTNPNLVDLIAVCSLLTLIFSSSTGTSHIAGALGIKTITLFCPLDTCSPEHWGNLGNKSINLTASNNYCQVKCPKNPKICPLEEITLKDAYSAIFSSLN
ncbi:MAG: glycosyltransferase family 9 protein [Bacteroidetes bacterium]|nr:glycosyltransferase family 9 protein [Bacteroidota bacterium]